MSRTPGGEPAEEGRSGRGASAGARGAKRWTATLVVGCTWRDALLHVERVTRAGGDAPAAEDVALLADALVSLASLDESTLGGSLYRPVRAALEPLHRRFAARQNAILPGERRKRRRGAQRGEANVVRLGEAAAPLFLFLLRWPPLLPRARAGARAGAATTPTSAAAALLQVLTSICVAGPRGSQLSRHTVGRAAALTYSGRPHVLGVP